MENSDNFQVGNESCTRPAQIKPRHLALNFRSQAQANPFSTVLVSQLPNLSSFRSKSTPYSSVLKASVALPRTPMSVIAVRARAWRHVSRYRGRWGRRCSERYNCGQTPAPFGPRLGTRMKKNIFFQKGLPQTTCPYVCPYVTNQISEFGVNHHGN